MEDYKLKIGDLLIGVNGKKFVIAHVGNNLVSLIDLHTGQAWQPLHRVENLEDISNEEFLEISGGFDTPDCYANAELKLEQKL